MSFFYLFKPFPACSLTLVLKQKEEIYFFMNAFYFLRTESFFHIKAPDNLMKFFSRKGGWTF